RDRNVTGVQTCALPIFTTLVWVNNAWIALQEVAFGITGFFVPYVLWVNAQGVGTSAALMHRYDELDTFFAFILPHGLMELTAIRSEGRRAGEGGGHSWA